MSDNIQATWQQCLSYFKDVLDSPAQYSAWFEPLAAVRFENGELTIGAPSKYFVEQLEARYLRLIITGVRRYFGENTQLFYDYKLVGDDPSTTIIEASAKESQAVKNPAGASANPFFAKPVHDPSSQLNPHYNFENYCCSQSNKLAMSIGEAIAANPKMKTFNPLFVFGPTGVGKTHLIQAIGIRLKENNPQMRVLYITARLFESQYTTAVHDGTVNSFIEFYQSIDTLIIDDVQDLAGKKPKTQNAFFHIFNHLHQNQRQLIPSPDCRPSEMAGLEERLLSRFKWGMSAELERPDLALRRDVLIQKALQDGLDLPEDVVNYIAENVTSSIRELEGVVVSLVAHATVLNRDINIDLARTVVANAVKIRRKQVNFEMIAQKVGEYYGVDLDLIFSPLRKREVADARQMVMYMAKKLTGMQFTMIGARMQRTHATVLHACRAIEDRLATEAQLQADVNAIECALKQ